jgi:chromosome segregation ATPase
MQMAIDRSAEEKNELQSQLDQQMENCRQLAEANDALSARTLSLAEEAASATAAVRKQLESQLLECQTSLDRAQEELDAIRTSEQSQRIALLDELNSMQSENASLRAQLRAAQKR